MKKNRCIICKDDRDYTVLYPENVDFEKVDEKTFSARRIPDRVHYRIVRCNKCGLVYSNPILKAGEIGRLYKKSKFMYGSELENIKGTYARYLGSISPYMRDKGRLLEIGCGNGFFLEKALEMGYSEAWGVEPSSEAVKKAGKDVRPNIKNDILRAGQFKKGFFDVVCFFQVLDHVPDPKEFLRLCHGYLREGGFVLCITHNINSLQARILGEKSPIIDVEHIFLFNEKTLRKIFEDNRFEVVRTFRVWNTYTLGYLAGMMPFDGKPKVVLTDILKKTGLGRMNLRLPLGNIGIIAKTQPAKEKRTDGE